MAGDRVAHRLNKFIYIRVGRQILRIYPPLKQTQNVGGKHLGQTIKRATVDIKTAKQIGQRLAIKSGLIGLLIAYALFGLVIYSWDQKLYDAVFWIFDVEFWYHLTIGAIGLLIMAYFFGQLAGVEILIKKRNELLTGIKYGLLTLVTGTLIGSSVGFIQEGIDNIGGFSNPFYDYYFKPMYWVTKFGIIPVIVVGLWFGRQIKRQGLKINMD